MKKQLHIVLMVLIVLAPGVGCRTPNVTAVKPPADSVSAVVRNANGLSVSIETVTDRTRAKAYLGVDALAQGYLPIFVRATNSNSDACFAVARAGFNIRSHGSPDSSATTTEVRSVAGSAVGTAGVVLIAPTMFFTGALLVGNANSDHYSLSQAELRDQDLSPGQSVSGFIFYPLGKGRAIPSGTVLVTAVDRRSQQTTTVEVPMTR